MTQDRKYYGMTVQQLGVLAGLAGFACLLFGATGLLVLRGSLFARSAASAPTAMPTSTILVLPTSTPTETPTPVPYEQLIPDGWVQHRTTLTELWLPSQFKNAAPGVVSAVAGSSVFLDLALVSTTGRSTYPASASVSYEPLTSDTLETFLDVKLSNIPPEINKAEHRIVSINSTDAVRLLFEGHSSSLNINDLLFVFQDGGTVWYVKYSAEIAEFYELLPVFEASVKTFRIVR